MSFDYPAFLFLFLLYIPMFFIDFFNKKYKQNISPVLKQRLKLSAFFFRVFFACAIFAIACPRWGTSFTVSEYRRGIDIVYAIDVSRSMDIRDAQHTIESASRLERGLSIAIETTGRATGARFAAAIGRGRGYLAVPLTWSSDAVLSLLETLDGSSMTGRSTNLEALVHAASEAFVSSSPAKKVIILLSDGEALSGSLARAVNRCASEGITVISVGLGSDDGRTIHSEENNLESPIVLSKRDAAVMRNAAEKTGGIYIDGSRDDAGIVLSNYLLSIAHETSSGRNRPEPKERRTLFIVLALIAYGTSRLMPFLPFGSLGKDIAIHRTGIAALAAFILFTGCTEGKMLLVEANYLHSRGRYDEAIVPYLKALNYEDAAPYAEYGLGLTFYLLDEGNAALKRFDSSQRKLQSLSPNEHRELRFRNNYNSGIIFFEEGDFQTAAMFFREALREDPRKIDAKHNLELSLLSIAKQTQDSTEERQQHQEKHEILFDYIRHEEQNRWESREWLPEEKHLGPDY